MKRLAFLVLFFPVGVFAYEAEFSIDYWTAIPHGYVKNGTEKISLKDDLKMETAKDIGGKIIVKGGEEESNLPNIIFMYTPIKFESENIARSDISFRGMTIASGEEFSSVVDYNSYDLGFLWDVGHLREKTEDRLDFRAGFSIRYMERSIKIESATDSREEKHKDLKPMLDLEAEIEVLPVHQNLRAEIILETQTYTNGNEFIIDIIDSIRLNYKHIFAEFGYRVEKYKMADDLKKISASGVFWSLGMSF